MSAATGHRTIHTPFKGKDRRGRSVELRAPRGHDAGPYLEHMRRLVAETPYMLQAPTDPLPTPAEQRVLLEQFERSRNSMCVAVMDPHAQRLSRVVGSLTCIGGRTRRTQHVCHLGMGVNRLHWGVGFGGLLLDCALTWAQSNPIVTRVALQVFETNEVARQLYRSRGFVEEGALRREVRLHGEKYEDLIGMAFSVDK